MDHATFSNDKDYMTLGNTVLRQGSKDASGEKGILNEMNKVSVAVQANDLELQQHCLILPARKIIFPHKLNCYQAWSYLSSEDNISDEEYLPSLSKKKPKAKKASYRPERKICKPEKLCDMKSKKNNDYESSLYGYSVHEEDSLANNERELLKGKEFLKCSHCQMIFSSKSKLKEHHKIHNGSNPFACSVCGKVFRSKDTMFRHKISHSGSKPFPCNVCKQGFSSAVALKEHKARHENQKLYKCSICNGTFRQNSSYRRHLSTHSKIFSYECSICSRRFSQKPYLRSHMAVHTGEKPHSCDQCGKKFAHLSDLKRHKVLHTGERPYKCDICGSSFADRSSRRRHQKEHENKSHIYMCKHCSSSFKRAGQLRNHITKKHSYLSAPITDQTKQEIVLKNKLCKFETSNGKIDQNVCCPSSDENNTKIFTTESTELTIPALGDSQCNIPSRTELNTSDTVLVNDNYSGLEEYSDAISVVYSSSSNIFKENKHSSNIPILNEMHCQDIQETLELDKVGMQKSEINSNFSTGEISIHTAQVDYVSCPDFGSQDYYNWLSNFTSLCKLLSFPVESDLFNKISQVHKTITDVLASPSGILSSKTNFKILMNISQDLLEVTNGHLRFMLDQLQD